ncbi:type VI secretion system secreted protein VgrG [Chryseobacterium sp. SORGH_AS909]|uniref:Type VI secretion system secreted protein VgrG n=2 Tax=Chryseobacterium group TaxID=2782232 RepID=A0ABU0TJK1_9FLAO|nr:MULTISPECIES: phage baseplate assembly protein V [Chryseobacterium]MDT3408925.1 type VI secretion system secreted protein VgrG [Pseudacidovorax intermedius]MDQ1097219.1 type VI secretion system secreted protein VgrG [Chryseobacterium camelliae]MDQ1101154.1 type VI secretion system secreted protein VgrG [Chryseobacterium sp. SORGH_AS_1048]MDR6084599.1 type VI secretion system secreted protein VgrG [Chryseobacterium sp. SORGH_AS_0909]MDR6132871.1 type VI secretion system secreted protein VgrG
MIKNDEPKINSGPDQVPENPVLKPVQKADQLHSEKFQEPVSSPSSHNGYPDAAAQNDPGMFMNEASKMTDPILTEDRIWSQQPTSKIHNAVAIAESQILGINRVVRLEIVIEGKIISHFKHFKLRQSAVKHHEFDLMLAYDSLGKPENHNLEEAQNFLGKRITVIFRYKDLESSPERSFVGVITEVGFSQEKGSLGNIVLSGFSPTVLLDAAPHIQSFGGKHEVSLNSIADQVIKEGLGQSKFDYRVDAQHGNVPYSSQYEETHYNYLARIAEAYGEQFYYDGEVLHFGKLPPQEKPVKLVYGSSVADIKIKMKAQHVNPTFYGYNSSKNEKLTTGSSKINHTSDIAKRAYEISEKIFTTPSLRVAPIKAVSFMDIDASQKGTAGSKASDVFVTTGSTTVPFLYPGCIADVEMRKTGSNETAYFTKLMIIATEHEVDSRGYYTGTFEAIASDTGYIPRPEFEVPRAEPQFAKVISNTDPLNQGRVQVQFDWQNGSSATEFIRVMTPDGGSSEKVSKNRGFMAIPEVGDQVIVNFVHQHPDRPFVMGGMFHGQVGAGGGTGNNIKSLSTRSGNKLELNDGEGSVFLTDQGGAHMKFDGAGNVIYNANNDSTKTIGNNKTDKVGNNKKLEVGCDHIADVGNTHKVSVGGENSVFKMDNNGVIDLTGVKKITLKVGSSEIIITGTKITVKSTEVEIKGSGSSRALFNDNTTIEGSQIIEN